MDPLRDVLIIRDELIKKDLQNINKRVEQLSRKASRAVNNKKIRMTYETLLKAQKVLKQNHEIRCESWKTQDEIEVLNKFMFLTSKPIVYLLNMSSSEFLENKPLPNEDRLVEAMTYNGRHPTKIIKYSVQYEQAENDKSKSQIDNILHSGYDLLDIIHFFTVGRDEVKAWAVRKGDTAVEAASQIHNDFSKGFISA